MMPAGRALRIPITHPPKRHHGHQARSVAFFVTGLSTALERWDTMRAASSEAPARIAP
jgi:hypothetical protein